MSVLKRQVYSSVFFKFLFLRVFEFRCLELLSYKIVAQLQIQQLNLICYGITWEETCSTLYMFVHTELPVNCKVKPFKGSVCRQTASLRSCEALQSSFRCDFNWISKGLSIVENYLFVCLCRNPPNGLHSLCLLWDFSFHASVFLWEWSYNS